MAETTTSEQPTSESGSEQKQSGRNPFQTIYKWGKLLQAKTYRAQLRLAEENGKAGLAAAWEVSRQAAGLSSPDKPTEQGGGAMPKKDDESTYLDSPVTTHQHFYPEKKPEGSGWLGTAAKLALGAGLMATGAGIPTGAWIVADALKNKATPEAQPETPEKPQEGVPLGDFILRLKND